MLSTLIAYYAPVLGFLGADRHVKLRIIEQIFDNDGVGHGHNGCNIGCEVSWTGNAVGRLGDNISEGLESRKAAVGWFL